MLQTLRVSKQLDGTPEIFHSIQGEGASIGKPAVFLRLALCNLSCKWCDTRYTWDWDTFSQVRFTIDMGVEDVAPALLKYGCRRVVVTGGEPLLQQSNLVPLLGRLKAEAVTIEVETNGTIVPRADLAGMVDQWNVSPKLGSSGNPRNLRERPGCYSFFRELPSTYFKFAVDRDDDLAEVDSLVHTYGLEPDQVILMPVASNVTELTERSPGVSEACRARGYLFSTRLHILLWGDRRGV